MLHMYPNPWMLNLINTDLLKLFRSQKLPIWAAHRSRTFFIFKFPEPLIFFSFFTVFLVLLLWGLSLRGWWYHRRHSALHKIKSLVLAKNYKKLKTQKKKMKLPSLKLVRYKASWVADAITSSFIIISLSLSLKYSGSYQTNVKTTDIETISFICTVPYRLKFWYLVSLYKPVHNNNNNPQ